VSAIRSRLVLLCIVVAAGAVAPAAGANPVPPGATWTEEYFPSGDGTSLHADVLRPKGLPADARTPVILTVSPYLNHSTDRRTTQPLTYDATNEGPSPRFFDFLTAGRVLERGYTYVMVDLRGTGGSGGCNDWGGPGEQMDVKAAVEWAASRPWSTGKVALYGKSYDAWTGLMGLAQRPRGLAAVIAQEPVVSGYLYLYMNRVRFSTSLTIPVSFSATDATPGSLNDSPQYILNSPPIPPCYALMAALDQQSDPEAAFWRVRDLVDKVKGNSTPTFLNEGFLEDNTKPDQVFDLWNNLTGPNHAWFGQFKHIRGNELELIGRKTWVAEAMRFLDHHVRGVPLIDAPTDKDPKVTVEAATGKWRGEERWPPEDVRELTSPLTTGSYTDDGENQGTGPTGGNGLWTFSQPLPHPAHIAGTPHITVDVSTTLPEANLVANVYDVDRSGKSTMISRGAFLVPRTGRYSFELYGQDWPLAAGHRIGVLISAANAEWWTHIPLGGTVTVNGGSIELPFLTYERSEFIDGKPTPALSAFRDAAPFNVGSGVITAATKAFALPPKLLPAPKRKNAAKNRTGRRLTAQLGLARGARRTLVVHGRAPSGARVTVELLSGRRVVATRRVRARVGAYRTRVRVRRSGRYAARVTARIKRQTLRATARARRVG
jgi:predicted acyl esterase